jgi:hypothetical protein
MKESVPMKIHRVVSSENKFNFDAAIKHASVIAFETLGDNMLLSWYDRDRDLESPGDAGECHEGSPTKGFRDYAANRGATLEVDFEDGRFVFCFRPLDEEVSLD